MVRFSFGLQPDYAISEALDLATTADALGFHACYVADDPRARDPWVLLAAIARETRTIRLGPSATHVFLREPVFIAQALATLDELSGGRAEAVVSFGDPVMLDAFHVEWRERRPLARVREALGVMRTLLDTGELDHDGDAFRYSGLYTSARPVQARVPLLVGAVGGPRSFELAGEVGDGVQVVSCSRENADFVTEHVRDGATRAGRDWRTLDVGAACVTAVAEDPAAAAEAARVVAGTWLASMPDHLIARHGLDPDELVPLREAMSRGDVTEAIRCTTPEMGAAFALAGTPEDCIERIRRDFTDAGIDHIVMAIADPYLVSAYAGRHLDGVPDVRAQLQLVHDRIFPAFRDRPD
jgi:5,10-methylenetetrahydromethanopterin reductase